MESGYQGAAGLKDLRVLIGCERSGVVREAFNAYHGVWAFSCDLAPPEDGRTDVHMQCDVLTALNDGWDLAIFHPTCTYLTVSAEWAYGDGPYHQNVKPGTLVGAARRAAREDALVFFLKLLNAPIKHIAIENPVGCISTRIRKPDQIIQPYQFGDDASKQTCLWLKNLPLLVPTEYIPPRIVNGKKRWANQTDSGQNKVSPSDDRWMERSRTYPGIAWALAEQYVKALTLNKT